MSKKGLPRARVLQRENLTDDLMKIWLEPPPEFQPFRPGQYCTIGVDGIERPYSIASAPDEMEIELFLELIPDTLRTSASLTPKLWELHEGDYVTIRPKVKGIFLLNPSATCHGMIATVTGIAPFVSMMRAMISGYYYENLNYDDTLFFIFQGASYCDEFGYDAELMSYDAMSKKITYIPTVSRPAEKRNERWGGGLKGRVNAHYDLIARYVPQADGIIYLCGNEGMVEDLGNTKPMPDKPLGKFIKAGYKVKQEVFF